LHIWFKFTRYEFQKEMALGRLKSSAATVPRTEIARGLAIVEGVGGQLFLAVLIARMVSLYARGKEANP
jgi:hypothetical protein